MRPKSNLGLGMLVPKAIRAYSQCGAWGNPCPISGGRAEINERSFAMAKATTGLLSRRKMPGTSRVIKEIFRYKTVYLLMLPALACLLVFSYIPMAGVVMAFNDYKLGKGFSAMFTSQWVGLANFRKLFSGMYFGRIFGNTVIINMMKLAFGFPAPILFAILLNEIKGNRFKKIVQTISYLPNFLSTVVVYGLVLSMLSPTYGLVNAVMQKMGMESIHFIAQPQYFRWILVILDIWRYTGYTAIIYLAAITSIDTGMYEAAAIDGASRLKRIWYITLPSISEIILLMLIINIGYILSGDFETTFLLYSPPVYPVGDIIDTYVYREGIINFQYSYTTAVGLFKSAVGLVMILGVNKIAKKFNQTGIW